ncbi:aflatoxin B1-aldehyde reductase, partial [Mycena leptocephala]
MSIPLQSSQFASRIPVIYGAGGIGALGTFGKLTNAAAAQPVVDAWCERVGASAIDSSNLHGFGTSERWIFIVLSTRAGDHSAVKLKAAYAKTIEALKGVRIRVLYLHAPDRTTPWTETMQTIDELYKEGKFEMFGLSNYKTEEVVEIVTLCRANGWLDPPAIERTVETELIPCLRQYGLKFAACCPLAGGYLAGHLLAPNLTPREIPHGSHFDPRNPFGMWYQDRYLPMGAAVRELRKVVVSYTLRGARVEPKSASVRWLQHHSALLPTDLGIYLGQATAEIIVKAYEDCNTKVKGGLPNFNVDPAWYDPECMA